MMLPALYSTTYFDWAVLFQVTSNCIRKYTRMYYIICCIFGPAPAYFTVASNFNFCVSSALDQSESCTNLGIKIYVSGE